jgi:hypothetical protein
MRISARVHRCRRVLLFTLSLLAGRSESTFAQDRSSQSEDLLPSVQLGIAASGLLSSRAYGLGVNVSIAGKRPFAFEIEVDATSLGRKERYVDELRWLYFWEVKQTLKRRDKVGSDLFVTYGTAGYIETTSPDARQFGSAFSAPFSPLGGFGGEYHFAKYAAIRVDAQVIWLLGIAVQPRLSGGVSIPIGGRGR